MNNFRVGQPVRISDGREGFFLSYGISKKGEPRTGVVRFGKMCALYPIEMIAPNEQVIISPAKDESGPIDQATQSDVDGILAIGIGVRDRSEC